MMPPCGCDAPGQLVARRPRCGVWNVRTLRGAGSTATTQGTSTACGCIPVTVPSCKLTYHGKSPFFMGKSLFRLGHGFNSYVSHYQRVYSIDYGTCTASMGISGSYLSRYVDFRILFIEVRWYHIFGPILRGYSLEFRPEQMGRD